MGVFVSSQFDEAGVVLCDSREYFLYDKFDSFVVDSPFVGEYVAARLALIIAHVLWLNHLIMEGDLLEVITLLSNPTHECPYFIYVIK